MIAIENVIRIDHGLIENCRASAWVKTLWWLRPAAEAFPVAMTTDYLQPNRLIALRPIPLGGMVAQEGGW